ncbi:MAG TPA: serine hydrolase domain-containing protein [Steroidobacteraceae bacterium]|nr:serine hydrolase domain-containing protein [Steroidobacteraceae bacterium]
MHLTRRDVLQAALAGAAATAGSFWVAESQGSTSARYGEVFAELDRFVEQFMREMNSPGMTLVLADRDGVQRVTTYGFGDLDRQRKLDADELFEIGSITKSFLALALLQLRDEGKLDLHEPIVEYLPWFRIQSTFAPITTHHLLTHSSGLPGAPEVFPSDPAQRHVAAYAPGRQFHYNNMAYSLLGHLAWTLDGRELPEIFRERIFKPLGMSRSEPAIDFDMRLRMPRSYQPVLSDRPYPRHGELCEAPSIVSSSGAGCIAATARDMGAYVQMIANRGRGPQRNLVSPESFELFAKRHIKAEEFGPTASYGYGIAVDDLDGNPLVRHTGGMVSYMSALQVDIAAGIGGFASVNAQQGYRPNAVVQYGLRLMRAHAEKKQAPARPAPDSELEVANAADYAGTFKGERGQLEFANEGTKLFLVRAGKRIQLTRLSSPDQFHVSEPELTRFPLIFSRAQTGGKVVEVSWGDAWYPGDAYAGPRQFQTPPAWHSYVGHYRSEDPWIGSLRVFILKGSLVLDGTPLEVDGELFRLRDEPSNTEWIRFGEIVNGKCMRLKYSGVDLWRVASA